MNTMTEKELKQLHKLIEKFCRVSDPEGSGKELTHREQSLVFTVAKWIREYAYDCGYEIK